MSVETAIRLTAKLYEARDAAKILLGEQYQEFMGVYGRIITRLARSKNTNELGAAGAWVRDIIDEGGDRREAVVIIAAAVELLEPAG